MSRSEREIKEKLKQIGFVYADVRLSDEELVRTTDLAWEEIYELEYEQAFGGWRGAHLDEQKNEVHITFDNAYGGAPLMVAIRRDTGERKMAYPSEDYVVKENVNISKIMEAMGMPREEAERYRKMHTMQG
jgi:hypothetical protein